MSELKVADKPTPAALETFVVSTATEIADCLPGSRAGSENALTAEIVKQTPVTRASRHPTAKMSSRRLHGSSSVEINDSAASLSGLRGGACVVSRPDHRGRGCVHLVGKVVQCGDGDGGTQVLVVDRWLFPGGPHVVKQ